MAMPAALHSFILYIPRIIDARSQKHDNWGISWRAFCRCLWPTVFSSMVRHWTAAKKDKHTVNCCCRAVLAVLYAFLIIFVIVDVTVQTKNYYNLVSLSGIIVYIILMFCFSIAPRKVSSFCYRATACNATHGIAVAILSVCPSVCRTRVLWQN